MQASKPHFGVVKWGEVAKLELALLLVVIFFFFGGGGISYTPDLPCRTNKPPLPTVCTNTSPPNHQHINSSN